MEQARRNLGYVISFLAGVIGGGLGATLIPWFQSRWLTLDVYEFVIINLVGIFTGTLPGWSCGLLTQLFIEKKSIQIGHVTVPTLVAFISAFLFSGLVLTWSFSWLTLGE